jgi:hypothetical protein
MQTKSSTRIVILGGAGAAHKPIRRREPTGRQRAIAHRTIVIRNGELLTAVRRG